MVHNNATIMKRFWGLSMQVIGGGLIAGLAVFTLVASYYYEVAYITMRGVPQGVAWEYAQVDVRTYAGFLTGFVLTSVIVALFVIAIIAWDRLRRFLRRSFLSVVVAGLVWAGLMAINIFVIKDPQSSIGNWCDLIGNLLVLTTIGVWFEGYVKRVYRDDPVDFRQLKVKTIQQILGIACCSVVFVGVAGYNFFSVVQKIAYVQASYQTDGRSLLVVQGKKYLILRAYANQSLAFEYRGLSLDQSHVVILTMNDLVQGVLKAE